LQRELLAAQVAWPKAEMEIMALLEAQVVLGFGFTQTEVA
jgi:hypothetical protein